MNDLEQVKPVPLTNAPPAMRRNVRETALRVLYAMDAGKRPVEDVLEDSVSASELDDRGRAYLQQMVAGTLDNRTAIDTALDRFATDFPTHRQAVVDRNILRLAAAEILFGISDAPAGAVVNEAVELAKKYSTKDSGRFVNGVLGALVRDHVGIEVPATVTDEDADETEPDVAPTRYWGEEHRTNQSPSHPAPDTEEPHV
ncbi:MAG: transcription antitermination factor NusB [Fibrella sp.]|nr:transcription antitermination factor NusB [Armatimonadota bacterium]